MWRWASFTRCARVTLLAGAALAVAAATLRGQSAPSADSVRVRGQVVDATTRVGIPGAQVSFLVAGRTPDEERAAWTGPTDEEGFFEGAVLVPGRFHLHVEALGYGTARDPVELSGAREMDVRVELAPEPLELPPLVVVSHRRSRLEASGFYERRRAGGGYSLTREEIEARRPSRATDVFRVVPGVQVVTPPRGGPPLLRFRGCYPEVVLDGVPLQGPVALDQIVTVDDIEAVEVHSGTFLPARPGVRACATVRVWTREGSSSEEGHGISLRRLLAVGAFVALSLLLAR